jgi:hypothetical protein
LAISSRRLGWIVVKMPVTVRDCPSSRHWVESLV